MEVSIVIPAFNASHCLAGTVEDIARHLGSSGDLYELIIVDDGSRILVDPGEFPGCNVIRLEKNMGKGFAVRTGMKAASGRIRLFMDADNSTDISHLAAAREKLGEGFDVVISSRSPKDVIGAAQIVPQNFIKRRAGIAGNTLIRWLCVPGIYDTQCGFKVFTARAAQEIFSRQKIHGFAFDVEVLVLARRLGLKIGIIPVRWVNETKSTVKVSSYLSTLLDILRISLR